MSQKGHCFYERYINEDKIASIEDSNIQRKFWVYFSSIVFFSVCGVTLATFVGFSFGNAFFITMFCWDLFMYFWLVFFSVRFVRLDARYGVFRRKSDPVLFVCGYLLLTIAFSVLAAFTTKVTTHSGLSFTIDQNFVYFVFIFLPLLIGYMLFCYYAFMKCFAKYARSGRKPEKKN